MEPLKNSINWFEIPVSNFERAQTFYSNIYDFEMPDVEIGKNRFGFLPVQQGGIGGAIVKGEGYKPSVNGALVYLNAGPDLQIILDRVEKSNGSIIAPKTLIAEKLGYFALIKDSEGNRVALHSMN